MPYIICVNQPGCLPESDPTAVATIEEAREAARDEVSSRLDEPRPGSLQGVLEASPAMIDALDTITELPESGGVIGPLPDGYVIDVRRVTWPELSALAGMPAEPQLQSETIDAYNQQ